MIRRDSFASRLARIGAACLWLSSCTYQRNLRSGFYTPTEGAKLPLTVAVSEDPSLPTADYKNPMPNGQTVVSPNPGFREAVHAELAAVFEKVVPADSGDASGADLQATYGARFPGAVAIEFKDPITKEVIRFAKPGLEGQDPSVGGQAAACVILFPICILAVAIRHGEADDNRDALEAAVSKALREIGDAIRVDDRLSALVHKLRVAARLEKEEAEGDRAAKADQRSKALESYLAALKTSVSLGDYSDAEDEGRLRGKIVALALTMTPRPAISDEVRSHTRKGQSFVMKAQGADDFQDGVREFEQALLIAPWFADGYINLALAQEKAGEYSDAIESLKWYLKASPNARDAEKIKAKMDDLEVAEKQAERTGRMKPSASQAAPPAEDAGEALGNALFKDTIPGGTPTK